MITKEDYKLLEEAQCEYDTSLKEWVLAVEKRLNDIENTIKELTK